LRVRSGRIAVLYRYSNIHSTFWSYCSTLPI